MKTSQKYTLEIQAIRQMIDDLKVGQVCEIQNTPGVAGVRTLGSKLEERFERLIKKLDGETLGDIEIAAEILDK